MDDDTRAERALWDARENDPAKKELLRLIYLLDDQCRKTPIPARQAADIEALIDQLLEAVRALPDTPRSSQ